MNLVRMKTLCFGATDLKLPPGGDHDGLLQTIYERTTVDPKDIILISGGCYVHDLVFDFVQQAKIYAFISSASNSTLDTVTVKMGGGGAGRVACSKVYRFSEIKISSTVVQFKNTVAVATGLSATSMRLIYCGKVCNDAYCIGDYILGASLLKKRTPISAFHVLYSLDPTLKVVVKVTSSNVFMRDISVEQVLGAPLTILEATITSAYKIRSYDNDNEIRFLVNIGTRCEWELLDRKRSLIDYGVTDKAAVVEVCVVANNSYSSPVSPVRSPLSSPTKQSPLNSSFSEEGASTSPSKLLCMRNLETALNSLQRLESLSSSNRLLFGGGARPSKRPVGYMTRTTSRYKGLR